MNKTYSLVWNEVQGAWTVVAEHARRHGKKSRAGRCAIAAAVSLLGLAATGAHALPTGADIASGKADILTSADGKAMSVNQHTDKLITNWQDFSIAGGERVSFYQPSGKSIALNRVIGQNGSEIQGQLDANGKVFLVNPNGVMFGKGAQVNVGGLVASTRNVSDEDFLAGNYRFAGSSQGAVVNEGQITAAEGGSVALLGAQVSNRGTIQAKLGRIALGAGNAFKVNFDGNDLLSLQVESGAVNAQAHNGGLLQADGGEVLMTARAAGDLLSAVVNNTGTIEARGLNARSGKITLDGGLVKVGGKLDAGALEADASGGVVTTRGERVEVANDVQVDTRAAGGRTGAWKIEAGNAGVAGGDALRQRGLVIGGGLNGNSSESGSGDAIQADTLARTLGTTNVELTNTKGNLTVDGSVNWASDNKLTLTSQKGDVDLKKSLDASGENAGLTVNAAKQIRMHDKVTLTGRNAHLELNSGSGHMLTNANAVVTLSGQNASFRANGEDYTVIHDLAGLRNVEANLGGRFVLGNAIKGSGRFRSIDGGFAGVFDGLGNTISGLTIYGNPDAVSVGLFESNWGRIANLKLQGITVNVSPGAYGQPVYAGSLAGLNLGTISNVHAKDVVVTGRASGLGATVLGGLVGSNYSGKIDGSSVSGRVEGDRSTVKIGGLAGENLTVLSPDRGEATISNSSADVQVAVRGGVHRDFVGAGGLVGRNTGTIDTSSSSGTVQVDGEGAVAGGLVGINDINGKTRGTIRASNSSSQVKAGGNARAGGLVGVNKTRIDASSASGTVTAGANSRVGGLAGENTGVIAAAKATGKVVAGVSSRAGGLVGSNEGEVQGSQADGDVIAGNDSQAGGLVGYNGEKVRISASTARGNVKAGDRSQVGGLVGENRGAIDAGLAIGTVTAGAKSQAGGLVGLNRGSVRASEASGSVTAGTDSQAGGLIGNSDGEVLASKASGNVKAGNGSSAGGLIGANGGTVKGTSASGTVTVLGSGKAGGLIGFNYGPNVRVSVSKATGDVSATGAESMVGGLVGFAQDGKIEDSSASGSVKGGYASYVGGLVGTNYGTISGASSSGAVSGGKYAKLGGLVGWNLYRVSDSTTSSKIVLTPGNYETYGALAGGNFGLLSGNSATGDAANVKLVGMGSAQWR